MWRHEFLELKEQEIIYNQWELFLKEFTQYWYYSFLKNVPLLTHIWKNMGNYTNICKNIMYYVSHSTFRKTNILLLLPFSLGGNVYLNLIVYFKFYLNHISTLAK